MLTTPLIHPPLLSALARNGHGAKVLITDGNYPVATGAPAAAERIHLNLRPGLLTVTQILETLVEVLPVERAEIMLDETGEERPAVAEYRQLLPRVEVEGHERFAFYDASRGADVAVVIASGDERQYANLLLTIGVRVPGSAG